MDENIQTPSGTIRQNEIANFASLGLIGDYPVAVRTPREVVAGGFADQARHPNTWTVYFSVEDEWYQVLSARGLRREWSSLDRLETWLRSMSFRFFWVRNDIESADSLNDETKSGPTIK